MLPSATGNEVAIPDAGVTVTAVMRAPIAGARPELAIVTTQVSCPTAIAFDVTVTPSTGLPGVKFARMDFGPVITSARGFVEVGTSEGESVIGNVHCVNVKPVLATALTVKEDPAAIHCAPTGYGWPLGGYSQSRGRWRTLGCA